MINSRKFDIRMYALIDSDMNLYVFKEGYIRTSSEPYDLHENKLNNLFIHLTNNAI